MFSYLGPPCGVTMPSVRRAHPYYKVQVYHARSLTWIERKQGFDTLAQAQRHIAQFLAEEKVRIVSVDEAGYHILED